MERSQFEVKWFGVKEVERGIFGLDNLGRRGGGFGFGLELFEGLEGTVVGAAGGINAPLELGEDARVAGAGLSEGQGFGGVGELLMLVLPELGFGGAEAAEVPLAVDDLIDEEASFGGSGAVVLVILVGELFEVGLILGGEDQGFGVDAGFEGVHGGGGFACDRGRASGVLGVAAVGFYLTDGGHGGSGVRAALGWTSQEAYPT